MQSSASTNAMQTGKKDFYTIVKHGRIPSFVNELFETREGAEAQMEKILKESHVGIKEGWKFGMTTEDISDKDLPSQPELEVKIGQATYYIKKLSLTLPLESSNPAPCCDTVPGPARELLHAYRTFLQDCALLHEGVVTTMFWQRWRLLVDAYNGEFEEDCAGIYFKVARLELPEDAFHINRVVKLVRDAMVEGFPSLAEALKPIPALEITKEAYNGMMDNMEREVERMGSRKGSETEDASTSVGEQEKEKHPTHETSSVTQTQTPTMTNLPRHVYVPVKKNDCNRGWILRYRGEQCAFATKEDACKFVDESAPEGKWKKDQYGRWEDRGMTVFVEELILKEPEPDAEDGLVFKPISPTLKAYLANKGKKVNAHGVARMGAGEPAATSTSDNSTTQQKQDADDGVVFVAVSHYKVVRCLDPCETDRDTLEKKLRSAMGDDWCEVTPGVWTEGNLANIWIQRSTREAHDAQMKLANARYGGGRMTIDQFLTIVPRPFKNYLLESPPLKETAEEEVEKAIQKYSGVFGNAARRKKRRKQPQRAASAKQKKNQK